MWFVTVEYTDGTSEHTCVDSYAQDDNALMLYNRFGVNSGERHIPLNRIKEWKVER